MQLDIHTLIVVAIVVILVPGFMGALVWRSTVAYPGRWVLGNFLAACALILLLLRGAVPDWISIVLANALAIGAALVFLQGIQRFRGLPITCWPECALAALAIAGVAYFRYITDNINARIVVMSAALGGIGILRLRVLMAGTHRALLRRRRHAALLRACYDKNCPFLPA